MPSFQYKALQADGKVAVGQIDAGGRQEAFKAMAERGLKPITLSEQAGGKATAKGGSRSGTGKTGSADAPASAAKSFSFGQSKKVTPKDLENFTRLLSSLLAAGVPLSRALMILTREASSPAAAAKWKEVHDAVIDGISLHDAMARTPETFPRVYTAMVEAGEAGGFLDLVLAQIADFQAREKEMKSKVMTAMFYPLILLVLATGVLIFLMVFFIPRFQKMFEGMGGHLPMITQIIIAISQALIHYGIYMGVGFAALIYFARKWMVTEKGKRVWENVLLKSPVVGPLVAQFAMARFCRMLGTLLGAGVPLVQSLSVARRSIGNQILVDAVANTIEAVQEGGSLGKSLGACRILFSGSVLEMISVAEESGKLDVELVRIALVTEGELDRQLKTAVAFAEPMMLLFIASFVGTIFIGMILPIFTLQDTIK
jgi:type II secretory pathway component PulF